MLIAGGNFTMSGDVAVGGLAAWDGTSWSAIGGGTDGLVSRISVEGSSLVINGTFDTVGTGLGTVNAPRIARWNGSSWSAFGSGNTAGVMHTVGQHQGIVYVAGQFITLDGVVQPNLAKYRFPCPADFDCSGELAVTDIFVFLSAWFAGLPAADFDGNALIEVSDIFAYLTAWFAGC